MNEPARILIVEDDWIVARAVQKILENAGFEVTGVVGSAAGALSSVHESPPDLILLDIVLGEGPDGIEVAKELRVLADVPIVFVTAHADATTLRRAAEVTPAGFVVKPFQEAQLLSTVTMAVTRASSDVTSGSEGPPAAARRHVRTDRPAAASAASSGGRRIDPSAGTRQGDHLDLARAGGRPVIARKRKGQLDRRPARYFSTHRSQPSALYFSQARCALAGRADSRAQLSRAPADVRRCGARQLVRRGGGRTLVPRRGF